MLFGIVIWVGILSTLLGLVSLITNKTVFFLKKPSGAKALTFWFGSSFICVVILIVLRAFNY